MKSKKSLLIYITTVIAVIIVLNLLADRFFIRLDFTQDKRYTLSKATKDILNSLEDPVTVTAYFSKDLPPDIARTRQDFKDLLIEYAARAKGNIVYDFVDPNKDDQTEQEAIQNGVTPVVINVREKDQSVQKKAYLGAVLRHAGKKQTIPFMQPGAAMEYALSSGIKKLIVTNRPLVGFIVGNGEPSVSMYSQSMASLDVLYKVEDVNLTDTTNLLKYKTLVLMGPKDTIPPEHLKMLDNYLANGGNLVIGINRVEGDLSQARGYVVNTGLETWLSKKGLSVDNSFVVDASCGTVGVRQQQSGFSFTTQLSFPYLPVVTNFAKNPITEGLEQVIFQFVSPITYSGDTTLHYEPLVFSSEKSGLQKAPLYFNIQKTWTNSDFNLSKLTLAALLQGKIVGDKNSRIILIGDGDFAVNGPPNSGHQLQPDNVNLLVNSIDWLSDDTGLMQLRTKGITSRPLEQLDDAKKSFLKWLNFLLPVILIILYGVFRMDHNRRIRDRRRSEDYNF